MLKLKKNFPDPSTSNMANHQIPQKEHVKNTKENRWEERNTFFAVVFLTNMGLNFFKEQWLICVKIIIDIFIRVLHLLQFKSAVIPLSPSAVPLLDNNKTKQNKIKFTTDRSIKLESQVAQNQKR